MIYLDNSATTFIKPKQVQRMVSLAMNKYSANPGRSGHKESLKTSLQIENIRIQTAEFFGCENPTKVIFCENCSSALNKAILGTAKKNGHIIATENEHNSVLSPLHHLKTMQNIDYSIATQSKNSKGITLQDIKKHIKENTYLIICNHISNVNGDICEIEKIGKFCKENNLLFLVDGAQSAGHEEIDMSKTNIDILTIAPHKGFYSLQGLGVLLLSENIEISPIFFGGTGTHSLLLDQPKVFPEILEVGTLSTPSIMAFGGGIDFVTTYFHDIKSKLDDLTTYCHYELSKLPVKIYTHVENGNGVLSFNVPSFHSNEVSAFLDQKYAICTRSGYHCAGKKHESLGTIDSGTVRVSFSYFNNFSDIQRLVCGIKHFLQTEQKAQKKSLKKQN